MNPFRKGIKNEVYNKYHPLKGLWISDDNNYLRYNERMFDETDFYYGHKECIKKGIEYTAPNPEIDNNLEYVPDPDDDYTY